MIFAEFAEHAKWQAAIYRGVSAGVGYGSTEFHVLRPRDPRHTEWIWALLRTQWFISRAMASFTGTAGQQRVPAAFLQQVAIPVPVPLELEAAGQRLLDVRRRVNELEYVARQRDELARSHPPRSPERDLQRDALTLRQAASVTTTWSRNRRPT